jgi:hypothetical protein
MPTGIFKQRNRFGLLFIFRKSSNSRGSDVPGDNEKSV